MSDDDLIEALKALAHPLRWRIVATLAQGERNVGEIEAIANIGQPALSQQLGVLRKANLVQTRKQAKLVYYGLANAAVAEAAARIASLVPGAGGLPDQVKPADKPAAGVANFARVF